MKRLLTSTAALMWGVQLSFLNPVLALLLVVLYGASPAQVGWVLAAYNASGFVAAIVVPAVADRVHDYLVPLLASALLTVALTLSLAAVTSLGLATAALVVFGGPAGMGVAMLFADMRATGESREAIINTRALISFAWVAGPPVATLVMGAFGNRSILIALAAVAALNVTTTVLMIASRRRSARAARAAGGADAVTPGFAWEPVGRAALVLLIVASALLAATNNAAVAAISLVVTDRLGLPLIWAGIALGVAAGCEVPALLAVGRLTRRFSNRALMLSGCLAGVVYYGGMALAQGPVEILALQPFNAWSVGITAGIGMTWFQQVIRRPGLAMGISTNTRRAGAVLSGAVIAVGAGTPMGYQGVFAASAVLSALALVFVALVRSRTRERTGADALSPADPSTDAGPAVRTGGSDATSRPDRPDRP